MVGVMKPPGGGCSDIFGGGATNGDDMNKRKNHMKSDPFGGGVTNGATPLRQRPGQDSASRLFGEPDPVEATKKKNHMQSDIINIDDSEKNKENVKAWSGRRRRPASNYSVRDPPVTGVGVMDTWSRPPSCRRRKDCEAVNGETEKVPEPEKPQEKAPEPQQPAPRGRVPPGGFSSKLW